MLLPKILATVFVGNAGMVENLGIVFQFSPTFTSAKDEKATWQNTGDITPISTDSTTLQKN